ncbi:MAG TPA: sigma-70 family RNA polymerase sigma factor [bacterium]|nr:sigma-70 family RNA polymerase sigma factor [bacterium]
MESKKGGGEREADLALVQRCVEGDVSAFETLALKYQQQVFNLAYRLTGRGDIVEDIAQEVFLKCYRALGQFEGRSSFATWLYRITVNTAINFAKVTRRHSVLEMNGPQIDDDRVEFPMEQNREPERSLELRQIRREISAQISSLSPEHRSVLILRDVQGLSYEEIAAVLDCPVGTVRSRLSRARDVLQGRLKSLA